MSPLFSIIITTYNYEKYIRQSLESAINQNFKGEYEVIVVNDHSEDNTSKILDEYDSIIRIENDANQSIEVSANLGINLAKGKYVVRLDADDYLEHYFLSEIYDQLEDDNTFYYGNYSSIDYKSSIISRVSLINFDKDEVRSRGDFLATGTVYPKQMLLDVGLYSEKSKNCGLENYELILKLIDRDYSGKHINKNLFYYRRHGNNLSVEKIASILSYGNKIAKENGLGCFRINQYHPYLEKLDTNLNFIKWVKYNN